MKFFSRFFQKEIDDPDIIFGRYSDSYKEEEKYDAWDVALALYEKGKYLECFKYFMAYLKDESLNNVKYDIENGKLNFEIFQGSKKITGYATSQKLVAEAKIAKTNGLQIGFLRRLIEKNYNLEYSRYALDKEDCITMVFDTYALDASPYKLYYALKELAINADKQDDILVAEFDSLQPVNTGHLRSIPDAEKEIKYQYLMDSIDEVTQEIENGKLNVIHYPGGVSYMILDLVYKLDFLLKPEGITMENLEHIHQIFFKKNTMDAHQKNELMRKELKEIKSIEKSKFFNEIYEVLSTFGITMPTGHERLRSLIDSDLGNMDWYYNNRHNRIALSIPGYIVGYCLYNFALPAPDRELLLLYYKIFEQDYFHALGFTYQFRQGDEFNSNLIIREIKKIRNRFTKEYPRINLHSKILDFRDECSLAKSFLEMMRQMDVTKVKKVN